MGETAPVRSPGQGQRSLDRVCCRIHDLSGDVFPQALSVAMVRRVCGGALQPGLALRRARACLPPQGPPRGPWPRRPTQPACSASEQVRVTGGPQGQAPPKPQGRRVSRRSLSASGFPDEGLYESSKDSRPSAQKTSSFQVCRVCGPGARGNLGATDPRCATSGLDSKLSGDGQTLIWGHVPNSQQRTVPLQVLPRVSAMMRWVPGR